jgi:hypothetical protein
MTVAVFTEAQHPFDGLLENEHQLSIDEVTIAPSQTIVVGALLGAVGVVADMSATPGAPVLGPGSSGDGVLTMDATAPIRSDAINGVYQVEFSGSGATATFNLIDPNGVDVGAGAVGTTFSGPLKFEIADDAAHHYNLGDVIPITVVRPLYGEQFEAWSPTATDGSQVPVAIACYPATTGAAQTVKIAALRRNGSWRASAINWPNDATTAQREFAQQQLLERKIVLR